MCLIKLTLDRSRTSNVDTRIAQKSKVVSSIGVGPWTCRKKTILNKGKEMTEQSFWTKIKGGSLKAKKKYILQVVLKIFLFFKYSLGKMIYLTFMNLLANLLIIMCIAVIKINTYIKKALNIRTYNLIHFIFRSSV